MNQPTKFERRDNMTDEMWFETENGKRNIFDRIVHQKENGIQNPEQFLQDIWAVYQLLNKKKK